MRVISGSARGLKLKSPDGIETRPTLDRVKEAVFSMLFPYLNGALVLDLFAGSGALGIESLSRGADRACFVDSSQNAIKCMESNIASARFSENADVYKEDAISFLKRCDKTFDIIFLDPPYTKNLYKNVIEMIAEKKLLSSDGLIVVEWDDESDFVAAENQLFEVFKEKKYGRVGITVLKWS